MVQPLVQRELRADVERARDGGGGGGGGGGGEGGGEEEEEEEARKRRRREGRTPPNNIVTEKDPGRSEWFSIYGKLLEILASSKFKLRL